MFVTTRLCLKSGNPPTALAPHERLPQGFPGTHAPAVGDADLKHSRVMGHRAWGIGA
ncbi:hypothetical protein [Tolypothrix sp. VBCCA 56010]|uniref:hypothetical protein n=1 Tax=Tolypothrix sp. VBCCA 56010 TaxID=3137731 RepID=UPI003D7EAF4B